eukprot:Em0003g1628a
MLSARSAIQNNTFQCILVASNATSFVIYLYADGLIQWTTGDASGGSNGLGGKQAQIGFNAGDSVNYVKVPGSGTPVVINITSASNVLVPGQWIYAVHEVRISSAVPSAPLNFTLSSVSGSPNQISASWTSPATMSANITAYKVYCNTSASQVFPEQVIAPNMPTIRSIVDGAIFHVAFSSGLNPFTQYDCYVVASNTYVPSSPLALSVSTVPGSPNQLSASWSSPIPKNGIIIAYTIYCNTSASQAHPEQVIGPNVPTARSVVNGTTLAVTFSTGLNPYTQYDCYVTANTSVGEGTPSPIITTRTSESVPSSPLALSVSTVPGSPNQLSASWSSPIPKNGIIIAYTIYCNTSASQAYPEQIIGPNLPSVRSVVNGTTLAVTFSTGLKVPYTQYDCYMTANTSVGEGTPSPIIATRTAESVPSSPLALSVSTVPGSPNQLSASWSPPIPKNGIIIAYTMYCNTSTSQAYPEQVIGPNVPTVRSIVNGTTLAAAFSTELNPYSQYDCYLTANTSVGEGTPSPIIKTRTLESVPSSPLALSVSTVPGSPNQLSARWSPPIPKNGIIIAYTIYCNTSAGQAYPEQVIGPNVPTVRSVVSGTTLAVTFSTGLNPFTQYDCYVTANTSVGEGTPSSIITTRTLESVPSSPLALSVSTVPGSPNQLSASWSSPIPKNGIIIAYTMYCNTSASQAYPEQVIGPNVPTDRSVVNGTTLAVTFSNGLKVPYTHYDCYVTANTSVGEGTPSLIITTRTSESVPSSPLAVSVSAVPGSPNQLSASWSSPIPKNGIIIAYTIYCNTSASQAYPEQVIGPNVPTVRSVVNGPTLAVTFRTGLIPYSQYDCYVTANTSVGEGTPSPIITTRTAESVPSSPLALSVSTVPGSPNQLSASWSPPIPKNGIIIEYTIYCNTSASQAYPEQVIGPNVPTVRSVVNGTTLAVTFSTGLNPFTQYDCYVTANTSVGEGTPSSIITTRTLESVPSSPLALSVSTVPGSPNQLSASWSSPIPKNGIIIAYTVYCNTSASQAYPEQVIEPNVPTVRSVVNGTTLAVTFSNGLMVPYTHYDCYVTANTSVGEGTPSPIITTRTSESVPSSPLALSVSTVPGSPNQLSASWSSPIPKNGIIIAYTVYCNTSASQAYPEQVIGPNVPTARSVVNGTTLAVTFSTGLNQFTQYDCYVTANTSVGEGTPSPIITTRTSESVPSSPLALSVSTVPGSPNKLSARWSPPIPKNGIIIAYTIYCNTSASQAYPELVIGPNVPSVRSEVNGTTLAVTFSTGLKVPYTQYDCYMTANTSVGEGTPSPIITKRTSESVPSSPLALSVSTVPGSPNQLSARWSPPIPKNGIIIANTIYCNTSASQAYPEQVIGPNVPTARSVVNGTTLAVTFSTGLNPFTQYDCYVTANTSVGEGTPSSIFTTRTLESVPSSPLALSVSTVPGLPNQLSASWSSPIPKNGIIVAYTMYCNTSNSQAYPEQVMGPNVPTVRSVVNGTTLAVKFGTGLNPYSQYDCYVTANTSVGEGTPSPIITIRTSESVPSSPLALSVSTVPGSPNKLSASWSSPIPKNGIIIAYTIYCNTSASQAYPEQVIGPNVPTVRSVVNGTTLAVTFSTGLNTYSQYDCYVTASTSVGEGIPSPIITTRTSESVPSSPLAVSVSAVPGSPNQLSASWSSPIPKNSIIIAYTMYCNTSASQAYPEQVIGPNVPTARSVVNGTTLAVTFSTGLNPFTQFVCYVTANTSVVPSSPLALSVSTVPSSPNQLSASWSPPIPKNGIIIAYTIYCNTSDIQAYPEQEHHHRLSQQELQNQVVLGLVPMSGCGWDLILMNTICSQGRFIFLVSIRLSWIKVLTQQILSLEARSAPSCSLVVALLLPLLIPLRIVCHIGEKEVQMRPGCAS